MPLISAMVFVPLLAAVVVALWKGLTPAGAHAIGLVASGLALAAAVVVWGRGAGSGFAQIEEVAWIPSLGVAYRVGVDGVSLPLNVLLII